MEKYYLVSIAVVDGVPPNKVLSYSIEPVKGSVVDWLITFTTHAAKDVIPLNTLEISREEFEKWKSFDGF